MMFRCPEWTPTGHSGMHLTNNRLAGANTLLDTRTVDSGTYPAGISELGKSPLIQSAPRP